MLFLSFCYDAVLRCAKKLVWIFGVKQFVPLIQVFCFHSLLAKNGLWSRLNSAIALYSAIALHSAGRTTRHDWHSLYVGSYEWQPYSNSAGVVNGAGTYIGTM